MTACVLAGCLASNAHASVVWDETTQGDLSNSGLTPTPLLLSLGINTVRGSTGNAGDGERDYFSFTVPTGATVTSILVRPESSVSGSSSFVAMQAGPQVTVMPTGVGIENLMGFLHYGNDRVGTDLLPDLAFAYRDTGLPSGIYSLWIQETGGVVPYGLDFEVTPSSVTPVPLPAPFALLACGLLAGVACVRRGSLSSAMPTYSGA